MKLRDALLALAKGGAEQRAVDAGEIDAVIDYANSNVVLLPAARRALRELPKPVPAASGTLDPRPAVANSLLAALPLAEYLKLLAGLEPLTVRFGEVLQQPGARIAHVHFPIDCALSLFVTAEDDRAIEIGLLGYEGMSGIPIALGSDASSVRVSVRAGGTALRMKAAHFRDALLECPALQQGLRRYADQQLASARQALACIAFHPINARLARWLLTMSDRVRSDEFFLTQALLADALGVRRATINEVAGPLRQRGLINFSRGKIRVLDRTRLEAAACGCYGTERRARAMQGD